MADSRSGLPRGHTPRPSSRQREARVTQRLELVASAVAGLAARLGAGGLAGLPDRRPAGDPHRRPGDRRPRRTTARRTAA